MYHEAIIQRVHILQCDSLWQFMTDSLSKEKPCFGPFDHDKRLITNGHNSNQIHFYFYFIIIQNILKRTKQSKSWPGIYDKFMAYINWRIKTSNKILIFWTFDWLLDFQLHDASSPFVSLNPMNTINRLLVGEAFME